MRRKEDCERERRISLQTKTKNTTQKVSIIYTNAISCTGWGVGQFLVFFITIIVVIIISIIFIIAFIVVNTKR